MDWSGLELSLKAWATTVVQNAFKFILDPLVSRQLICDCCIGRSTFLLLVLRAQISFSTVNGGNAKVLVADDLSNDRNNTGSLSLEPLFDLFDHFLGVESLLVDDEGETRLFFLWFWNTDDLRILIDLTTHVANGGEDVGFKL